MDPKAIPVPRDHADPRENPDPEGTAVLRVWLVLREKKVPQVPAVRKVLRVQEAYQA
jgi:hypothetical protein